MGGHQQPELASPGSDTSTGGKEPIESSYRHIRFPRYSSRWCPREPLCPGSPVPCPFSTGAEELPPFPKSPLEFVALVRCRCSQRHLSRGGRRSFDQSVRLLGNSGLEKYCSQLLCHHWWLRCHFFDLLRCDRRIQALPESGLASDQRLAQPAVSIVESSSSWYT